MTSYGQVAILCTDLRKQFVLRHTRSLKEALVWLVKGRKGDLSKKFLALKDVSLEVKQGDGAHPGPGGGAD
jgi:ABC-2 type transport system ATP-binding protein